MIPKKLQNEIIQKCSEYSDENINWLINSLYLQKNVDGPYESIQQKKAFQDHKNRKMYKQIILGNYGMAAIVYSIEGSPPRGMVMATTDTVFYQGLYISGKYHKSLSEYESSSFNMFITRYFIGCYKEELKNFDKQKYHDNLMLKEVTDKSDKMELNNAMK